MEYIIYCDESISRGKYYSNFYGGALIRNCDFDFVVNSLNEKKIALNLFNEIKWNKVSDNYLEKYKEIINLYFKFIMDNKIKIRIMFSQNAQVPVNLTKESIDNGFHLLYYQFVKHAFGLIFHDKNPKDRTFIRLYFDKLPDNNLKNEIFKSHIYGLQGQDSFRKALLKIRLEDISEVDSHKHVVLQCMDIILGSMAFRLNDLHKEKCIDTNKRGKKTIAKNNLYEYILSLIRKMEGYENFNIGITTGRKSRDDTWNNPYRHWRFTPTEFTIDKSKYK
jgi:hypothetical protein